MTGTPTIGIAGWDWRPLVAHGVAHLVPPQRGPRSTTACYRPIRGALPLAYGDEQRCERCAGRLNGTTA